MFSYLFCFISFHFIVILTTCEPCFGLRHKEHIFICGDYSNDLSRLLLHYQMFYKELHHALAVQGSMAAIRSQLHLNTLARLLQRINQL